MTYKKEEKEKIKKFFITKKKSNRKILKRNEKLRKKFIKSFTG
jgi:hypothetical protein